MTPLPPPTSKKLAAALLENAKKRGWPWGGKKYFDPSKLKKI